MGPESLLPAVVKAFSNDRMLSPSTHDILRSGSISTSADPVGALCTNS